MNTLFILSVSFSVLILAIISWVGTRGISKEDTATPTAFFLSKLPIGQSQVISTLMATNTALALIVFWFSYLGWLYGLGAAFWLSLCWVAGLELFAVLQSKFSDFPLPDKNSVKYQTLHEYISPDKKTAQKALAVVSIITFCLMMTVELTRGMRVLDYVGQDLNFSKDMIAFVVLIFAAIYSAYGGLKAVIKTDELQWYFTTAAIILTFLICVISIWGENGLFGSVYFKENFNLKAFLLIPTQPYFIVGSLFSWASWFLVTMDMWQRAAAARTINIIKNETRKTLYPWFIFLSITSVSIGLFVRVKMPENFNISFPAVDFLTLLSEGLTGILILDYTIFIVIFVGFITAMISTLDTYFLSVTHTVYNDLSDLSQDAKFSRLIVFLTSASLVVIIYPLFLIISHTEFSINALLYVATSLPFVLLPPLLFSKLKHWSNSTSLILSAIVGIAGTMILIFILLNKLSNAEGAEIGQIYNYMYLIPMSASVFSIIGFTIGKLVTK